MAVWLARFTDPDTFAAFALRPRISGRDHLRLLAEMAQETHPSTLTGVCQVGVQFVVQLQLPLLERLRGGLHVVKHHITYLLRVLRAVKRDALCVFAVAPCTAALLHEVREGLDTSIMDHPANGRLVDSHAEGNGGHHDLQLIQHEEPMQLIARGHGEPCMVGGSLHALHLKPIGDFFTSRPGQHINDRRGHGVHRGIIHSPIADRLVQVEDLGEVLLQRAAWAYHKLQVGSIDRTLHQHRIFRCQPQAAPDVFLHLVGTGGRQRHGGRLSQCVADLAQPLIALAKVVAPCRDTVRLVDRQQTDRVFHFLQLGQTSQRILGTHVHYTSSRCLQGLLQRGTARCTTAARRDLTLLKGAQLVLHQGDQW
mmetsp:Transcript_67678/g.148488  ORF Transcript_67678/g.148488 Transcript_67678/m.148488 type:complete len:367 (-) Transcript_67678:191-1291(-)